MSANNVKMLFMWYGPDFLDARHHRYIIEDWISAAGYILHKYARDSRRVNFACILNFADRFATV